MANIEIIDCGTMDYQSALALQEKAFQNLLAGSGKDTVFIVEHPPTITLGARQSANKLLKAPDAIKLSGIEIFQIRRGGGATAHNPGQIVIYPIINLKKNNLGVSDFVHLLEKIGIEFLAELGVSCQTRKAFPGLWISASPQLYVGGSEPRTPARRSLGEVGLVSGNQHKKIASIGVQIKKWLTFHGMAININNDLDIFDFIIPCGLDNIEMTSAENQLNKKINLKSAKSTLKTILLKHFTG
jgi:lipoate-protein ligase B